jgi:hypothetical protein
MQINAGNYPHSPVFFFFCLEHKKIEAQTEILGQLNFHSSITWQTREMINSCILFKIASSHFIFNALIDSSICFSSKFSIFPLIIFHQSTPMFKFLDCLSDSLVTMYSVRNRIKRREISSNKNFK